MRETAIPLSLAPAKACCLIIFVVEQYVSQNVLVSYICILHLLSSSNGSSLLPTGKFSTGVAVSSFKYRPGNSK